MKCGSVLTVTVPIDVNPPRAGWTKIFRPMSYWLHRIFWFCFPEQIRWSNRFFPADFLRKQNPLYMFLSVVPGLGHYLAGELPSIRLYLAAWAGLMLGGLFLFGTMAGSILLGFGIAVHVWIITDAGRVGELFASLRSQVIMTLILFYLVFVGIYAPIRFTVGYVLLRGGYANADIPTERISEGDYLLLNPRAYDTTSPKRGDIILGYIPRMTLRDHYYFPGGDILTKVVGLPGEKLEFKEDQVTCWKDGKVVGIFKEQDLAVHHLDGAVEVPEGLFLCLMPSQFPDTVGLISHDNVRARAFMVYNPIWRRGFIHYQDLSSKNALTQ